MTLQPPSKFDPARLEHRIDFRQRVLTREPSVKRALANADDYKDVVRSYGTGR